MDSGPTDDLAAVVGLHFPADFIWGPFAAPIMAPLTEAATDVELCWLDRSMFEALLVEPKRLEEAFVRQVTAELDAAREWMLLLGQKTAEERMASLILRCLTRLEPPDCAGRMPDTEMRIELPLSRTEIAQFLGLTIEKVSCMLKRLWNGAD